jgi:hypothetical protein
MNKHLIKIIVDYLIVIEDMNTAINDIEEVYYHEQDFEDEHDRNWRLICKSKNNIYYYYEANCDYTGFTCQAGMYLRAYHDFDDFIKLGVDKRIADKFKCNNKIYKDKLTSVLTYYFNNIKNVWFSFKLSLS